MALDKIRNIMLAAKAGNAEAQNELGFHYIDGKALTKDYSQAIIWLQKAAAQNHKVAFYNIGMMQHRGLGLAINIKQAIFYYTKAAELDYIPAQYQLGCLYQMGPESIRNEALAIKWYELAANHQFGLAQTNLAYLFLEKNKPYFDERAVALLEAAVSQNIAVAKRHLGFCYLNGRGCRQDIRTAINYYKEAAEVGEKNALYDLGCLSQSGAHIPQDLALAAKCFHGASLMGHPQAKAMMLELARTKQNPLVDEYLKQQ